MARPCPECVEMTATRLRSMNNKCLFENGIQFIHSGGLPYQFTRIEMINSPALKLL